jgi:rfaE bifunctional protein kinase chain/domain
LDGSLTEPSIETGLDAYQVVGVRSYPGAAGTVINNLVALGVGRVLPISMVGDDGEGFELLQALQKMPNVDLGNLTRTDIRRTPTYTKPMLRLAAEPARELNRLDIKNRQPLPATVETAILRHLTEKWPAVDVLLVLDQVSEADCGVVTAGVRERLADLAAHDPDKIVIVDSRERIGLFRNTWLKPNERECERAANGADLTTTLREMSQRCNRPVFCTRGEKGMLVAPSSDKPLLEVPGYPVKGPIDIVGAGDSSSAALACALASGTELAEAAAFANLVASITIQQIGVTGTATPEQVRERWRQV